MQEKDKASVMSAKSKPKNGFHIEVDKIFSGFSVLIYGVTSIRSFSTSEVQLRSGKSILMVSGSELTINVYEGYAVEISGKVDKVEFL